MVGFLYSLWRLLEKAWWRFILTGVPAALLDPFDLVEEFTDKTYDPPRAVMWWLVAGAGFVSVAWAYHLLRVEADMLRQAKPKLRFGRLFCARRVYINEKTFVDDVKMWRVEVFNDGDDAHDVKVTAHFVPGLPHMPGWQPTVTLHRNNDMRRTFPLPGRGSPEFVDILAASNSNHELSHVASVEAEEGYIYYENDQFAKAGEFMIELVAQAAGSKVSKTVYVWFDQNQWMYMTEKPSAEMSALEELIGLHVCADS